MKRFCAISVLAVLVGVLTPLLAAPAGAHALDCAFGTYDVIDNECEVAGLVSPGPGPHVFGHTLHVLATGHVDGSASGITINVTGNVIVDSGGVIEADDDNVATPNTGASPITLTATGDLTVAVGGRISADNNDQGGAGGDITITVANLFMAGTDGTDACRTYDGPHDGIYGQGTTPNVYLTSTLGARISALRLGASASTPGGDITITVGDILAVPPTGVLDMRRCSIIDVSSHGSAGAIVMTVGHDADVDGLVLSESGLTGTGAVQAPGGGPITIEAGCELLVSDTGMVSSRGQDPGADLVHLEGCEVLINGVVRSTAPGHGHALPNNPANHCNLDVVAHPPGDALGFTGCVEVWGKSVTVDATGTHNGQVNVDGIRAPMRGWIDLFAVQDVTILGDTPSGGTGKFAVEADACPVGSIGSPPCSNSFGGLITVKAVGGKVTTTGQAILQANASAIGSDGGGVIIQSGGAGAAGNIDLDGSFIEAKGPSGSNTKGGAISIQAFNAAIIGSVGGHLDATGDGVTFPGNVALTECGAANQYLGTIAPVPPNSSHTFSVCGGAPTLPSGATSALAADAGIWEACELAFKSGTKFEDTNGNHVRDEGELGLEGWEIHIFNADQSVHDHMLTAADGSYEFAIPAGSYTVCETIKPGWTQTYPVAGPGIVSCAGHGGGLGYSITLTVGQRDTGNDFGNDPQPWCEKQPVQEVLNPTTGRFPGNVGPDVLVRVDLGQSVQAAVDAATDTNGDGYVIVAVSAKADGTLGGSSNQAVAVTQSYPKPFALIGCSVTLRDPTPKDTTAVIRIATSAGSPANIFLMDLHASTSTSAAGILVEGDGRYLRNEQSSTNYIGVDIRGNGNTMHNGAVTGNTGAGVKVTGNSNILTDADAFSNKGGGFVVVGNSNQLLKLDAGDSGKGNTGDGVKVTGNSNLLSENRAFANTGDGIDVAGSTNTLSKNVAGDSGKGNGVDGFYLVGATNTLTENKATANKGDGFDLAGGLTSATANKLQKNQGNTGASGKATHENTGAEFRLKNFVFNNNGGNQADTIEVPKTTVTAKCAATFPVKNAAAANYAAAVTCE